MEHIGLTVSVMEGEDTNDSHTNLAQTAPLPTQISQDDFAKYFVKNSIKLLRASGTSAKLNCQMGDFYIQISETGVSFVHNDGLVINIKREYISMFKAIGSVCKMPELF